MDEGRILTDGTNRAGDRVQVLETNLDDSTPEQLGDLLEQLLTAGALDAGYLPLQMKKNRPGTRLTLLCEETDRGRFLDFILSKPYIIRDELLGEEWVSYIASKASKDGD